MAFHRQQRTHQLLVMAMVIALLPLAGCKTPNLSMTRDTRHPFCGTTSSGPRSDPAGWARYRSRRRQHLRRGSALWRATIIRDNQIGPPYQVAVGQTLVLTPPGPL